MDKKSAAHLRTLDQKLTQLLKALKNYSDVKLNEQPNENSWSVLQIMQHLMYAEAGSIAYVKKKLSYDPQLKKAGMMTSLRSMMLNAYLVAPLKIKAPEAISGDALRTNLTFWEVAKQWKQQRKELENYLQSLPDNLFETELYKHPMSGKMTLSSMLSFFNGHMDRHTRQIRKTLKKVDAVQQV